MLAHILNFFSYIYSVVTFGNDFSINCTTDKIIGLDPAAYKSSVRKQDTQDASLTALMNDEERFKVYMAVIRFF